MTDLNDWADTAAGNDRTQLPDYLPEGATPVPAVNDWARESQAATRVFYETLEWRNFLDDSEVPVLNSDTSFTVPASKETLYIVNQRVEISGLLTNDPAYGVIASQVGDIITVVMDDPLDLITADITGVKNGFSPDGFPVTSDFIYDFDGAVTTVINNDPGLVNLMQLVDPATEDNAVIQDATGQVVDAGYPLTAISRDTIQVPIPASGFNSAQAHAAQVTADTIIYCRLVPTGAISDGFSADSHVPFDTQNATGGERFTTEVLTGVINVFVDGSIAVSSPTDIVVPVNAANFDYFVTLLNFNAIP